MKIELNVTETHAIVDGGYHKILDFRGLDMEGKKAVTINIEGVGEFISYDVGDSWNEMDQKEIKEKN
jgi:hypothetical protein